MKLTAEQAQAITRVAASPEGRVFLALLSAEAELLNRTLIMRDDIPVELTRGELRAYTRIFDVVEKAPGVLEQYKTQT